VPGDFLPAFHAKPCQEEYDKMYKNSQKNKVLKWFQFFIEELIGVILPHHSVIQQNKTVS
jgi:hypothetical protein